MLWLQGTSSKAHGKPLGPAIFCTFSCFAPPMLAHVLWQTIWAQLEMLIHQKSVPAKKVISFQPDQLLTVLHRSCYKGAGGKHMAQSWVSTRAGPAWTWSCWSPDNYILLAKASPHTYSRQYAILSFLNYFNIWYCSSAHSYSTQTSHFIQNLPFVACRVLLRFYIRYVET